MVANIRLDSKQVEVLHWDKFQRQQDFDAKLVRQDKLPVPSPDFKEQIGRSFPGMKLEWTRLDCGRYRNIHGIPGSSSKWAIGIYVSFG